MHSKPHGESFPALYYDQVKFTDQNPPLPSKTTIFGLLQIRVLHLRKRREKSFPTVKMFLALKLCKLKVVNLPLSEEFLRNLI